MKKIIVAISALALVMCSACQKFNENGIESKESTFTLNGYIEKVKSDAAKTTIETINENKYAVWSSLDSIKVFGNGTSIKMEASQVEKTYAVFTTFDDMPDVKTLKYALYPYQKNASLSGNEISFVLPSVQKYNATGFADGSNFAVGTLEDGDPICEVRFKNVCGYLRLSLTADDFKVRKIVLMGFNGNEKLSGTFKVDASQGEPKAVALSDRMAGDEIITLDCGNAGVELNPTVATDFLFVVPVDALEKGFMATVYDTRDERINVDIVTTKSTNKIQRSFIINMPEKQIKSFPFNEYQILSYIQANGGTWDYIDTGFNPKDGVGVAMKGTMLSNLINNSRADNPAFFGVVKNYNNSKYVPWLTVDYWNSQNSCRVAFNGANALPPTKVGLNQPFELEYAMFKKGEPVFARVNGEVFEVKDNEHPAPSNESETFSNGNIFLFCFNSLEIAPAASYRAKAQINYFKLYDYDRQPRINWIPVYSEKEKVNGLYNYVTEEFSNFNGFGFAK